MNLGLKIKNLREERGLTQIELANLSGISRASIQLYEADKVEIPVKKLSDISKALDVDTDFFMKNQSSLVVRKSDENLVRKSFVSSQKSVVSPSSLKKSHEQPNIISIPYFEDTYASAGNGVINYDEAPVIMDFDEEFLRMFLRISGNIANMHIINSRGDSMEPTIASGELLFINPMQNENGLISGCIYIISYEGDIFVKRVEKNPVTKAITLFSDNEKYKPIVIEKHNLEQCYIIGRVVSHMKRV